MFRLYQFIISFIVILGSLYSNLSAFPILPEIQVYHTIGTRESSYSTVSGGLAIQLSNQQLGRNRWMHVLGIYNPELIANSRVRVSSWSVYSEGLGLELGLYDQWGKNSIQAGASIGLRHIEWEKARLGDTEGKLTTDIFHMGWASGKKFMFLFGVDIGTIHTPLGSFMELQLALGGRYNF